MKSENSNQVGRKRETQANPEAIRREFKTSTWEAPIPEKKGHKRDDQAYYRKIHEILPAATACIGPEEKGDKKKAGKTGVGDQVSGVRGQGETAKCHCEECSDEAISTLGMGDCFASLAMT
jgi:hypothetical protein